MAIQRRKSDTGIYRHVERDLGTIKTPHGERLIPADGQHILAEIERLAELELKHWQQHAKRLALATMRSPMQAVKRPRAAEPAHTAERLLAWLERMIEARDAGDTDKALWRAFVVGRFYESLRVRPREPAAKYGAETLVQFRGSWVKATKLEGHILGFMETQNKANVAEVAKACWGRRDVGRGVIDKALTGLRTQLLGSQPPTRFQFLRRGDSIVVE
jgi:hypothetical protein